MGCEVALARRASPSGRASGARSEDDQSGADAWLFARPRQPDSGQFRILLEAAGAGVRSRKAKQLLAEAGYPNGFDAGFYNCDSSYPNLAEAANNYLGAIGIRAKLRPLERVSFDQQFRDKKLKNIIQAGSGSFGNAATQFETFVVKGGAYAYGSYPDLDAMFDRRAARVGPR